MLIRGPTYIVMPANAGIHDFSSSGHPNAWISAFAGMTRVGRRHRPTDQAGPASGCGARQRRQRFSASSGKPVLPQVAGLTECDEGAEHFGQAVAAGGAFEAAGDVAGGDRALAQSGAEGDELGRFLFRPAGCVGDGGFGVHVHRLLPRRGAGFLRRLEFGAEPADQAGGFLFDPFGVQAHDAGDYFGFGQVARPAVGVGDSGIQAVVQFPQDGDLTGVVDVLFGGGQGRAGADGGQDVVEGGKRQMRVRGEAGFAVGVEFLGNGCDGGALLRGGIGEGERIEALGFCVYRIVTDTQPISLRQHPGDVMPALEHPKQEGISTTTLRH